MDKETKIHKILEVEKCNKYASIERKKAIWNSLLVVASCTLIWAANKLAGSDDYINRDSNIILNAIGVASAGSFLINGVKNINNCKNNKARANFLLEEIRLDRIRIDKDKRIVLK